MKPLRDMPMADASAMIGIFADIDDTITTDGQLPAASYQALEDMKHAGFAVVLITGRPAGWCDMIARFWPVHGVVGENGAFYFAYDHKSRQMIRRFVQSEAERAEGRMRLQKIKERVLTEVPGSAVASDQL
jgi:hydroxymethylpyrimidine pyrophosphatase-like HAD family hydrolase